MNPKKKKIRIIAGKYKGALLSVDHDAVKPTPDRIRETVFNWLTPFLVESRVIELYGGTGSLSVESISRGSKSSTFIDSSKKVCEVFKDAIIRYRINGIEVICADANKLIKNECEKEPYDLIFLDPPYQTLDFNQILSDLYQHSWANQSSLIYLESNTNLKTLINSKYELIKDSKAGNVYYGLLRLRRL
jgi:16S rRNA (guanine966-N2)-methyltransferase